MKNEAPEIVVSLFVMSLAIILPVFIGDKTTKEERMINIKSHQTVLVLSWVINLIIFTTTLWLGEYALHSGLTWMKKPIDVTLVSSGIAKMILSTMLIYSFFTKAAK